MTDTTDTDRAEGQARAQLDGIVAMMARLEHASGCDGDDCELDGNEIMDGLAMLGEPDDDDREKYHDEDHARQAIDEDPLSVQVRSDWHSPGGESEDAEYEILLCTGGPACRIVGTLGQHGTPDHASIEYQDWRTPWAEHITTGEAHDALLAYAQHFYWGD